MILCLWIAGFIALCYAEVVYNSFVRKLREEASSYCSSSSIECKQKLENLYRATEEPEVALQLYQITNKSGMYENALLWIIKAFENGIQDLQTKVNVGLAYHYVGDYKKAIQIYLECLDAVEDSRDLDCNIRSEILFNIGVSYQHSGNVDTAALYYYNAAECNSRHSRALLNLAAMHHGYGNISMGIEFYRKANYSLYSDPNVLNLDLISMTRVNCIAAMIQSDQLNEALTEYHYYKQHVKDIWENHLRCGELSPSNPIGCDQLRVHMLHALTHIMNANRRYCHLLDWEKNWMELFSDTMMRLFSAQKPILPPFDALLLPYIRGSNILAIAQHASRALQANIVPLSPAWFFPEHTRADPLRVGMISYDVNNHPTAHLMEAIIEECRLLQPMAREVQIYVFSYGRDDNSTYRRNIQQGAFRFIDLALLGYQEAAEVIRSEMIDVLLEMQLHTLGHRMQITAYHPAPVQINYLVYPGTSGATFLSHIIADHIVIPPERAASDYSEKMLYLQPTYQISFESESLRRVVQELSGDRQTARTLLRHSLGIPPHAVLLCNFNKMDKIDPISIQLWMQILRRNPTAYLWMLEPIGKREISKVSPKTSQQNRLAVQSILSLAKSFGIDSKRILFAPRVEKWDHVLRHKAIDLFVDTVVYGAHSTATDSLRGYLPVLSAYGDSFPARVAGSLYESFSTVSRNHNHTLARSLVKRTMMLHSVKEMEDMAIRVLRKGLQRWGVTDALSRRLSQLREEQEGFFDSARAVRTLHRGWRSVVESEAITRQYFSGKHYHVVTL